MYFSLSPVDLKGSILVLPSVSIGNVAQLTVDLLINSFPFEKVGFLEDPNVLPFAGNDAYLDGNPGKVGQLHSSLEIYHWKERKITLLQQRSPVVKLKREAFAKNLLAWIQKEQFGETYLITGADASKRIDSQLLNQQLRYLVSSHFKKDLSGFEWKVLENAPQQHAFDSLEEAESVPSISSAGITKAFVKGCEEGGIAAACVILFTNEGDNIPGSIHLANHMNALLKLVPAGATDFAWRPPSSWNILFGASPQTSLYL